MTFSFAVTNCHFGSWSGEGLVLIAVSPLLIASKYTKMFKSMTPKDYEES